VLEPKDFSITPQLGSLAALLPGTCLFTCTVTDAYGNTVSALGGGHSAKVTITSGSGSPLAIPATGAAESATTFTSKSSGSFAETITAAAQEGFAYAKATLTATK
jgi:hypothetical protein